MPATVESNYFMGKLTEFFSYPEVLVLINLISCTYINIYRMYLTIRRALNQKITKHCLLIYTILRGCAIIVWALFGITELFVFKTLILGCKCINCNFIKGLDTETSASKYNKQSIVTFWLNWRSNRSNKLERDFEL